MNLKCLLKEIKIVTDIKGSPFRLGTESVLRKRMEKTITSLDIKKLVHIKSGF